MVFGKWILYLHARGRPGIGPLAGGQARGSNSSVEHFNILYMLNKHNPVEHFIYFKHNPVDIYFKHNPVDNKW